ncbi:MAG: iron ABC transporter permease [Armatimonadetes bacterium]|nr:iron ABC transporter permease [Armatimonadota bacterium]MDW8122085.1 iron ABC transporter permease [Armatimonadota bacterium]
MREGRSPSSLPQKTFASSLLTPLTGLSRRYAPSLLLLGLAVLIVFVAFLFYPIFFLLIGALKDPQGWTLGYFLTLFRDPELAEAVQISLLLASATTVLTLLVAVPVAFFLVRYRILGRSLLSLLILGPMILPPFVGAIAVRHLLARAGPLNQVLIALHILDPQDPNSWISWLDYPFWMTVILQVLHFFPIAYLNIAAALSRLDPTIEEAARSLGASGWRLIRTVTLPLISPGLFAAASLLFILSFTDLGTPLVLHYHKVVSVRIFHLVETAVENPPGYALVLLVMIISVVAFLVAKRLMERVPIQTLPSGRSVSDEKDLPPALRWALPAIVFCLIFVSLIPHIAVLLTALSDRWAMTILPDVWTFRHFQALMERPLTLQSIQNSLFYSTFSTLLDLVLGLAIAYLAVRRSIPFAHWLDSLAMLPLAIPGLVVAFGYVAAFSNTVLDPRKNPSVLLIIAYAIRRLPYMVRACSAGLRQASETLEEASQSLGASPLKTFFWITLPQILPHLIAGAVMAFAFAMLEVADSLILAFDEAHYPMTKAIYALANRLGDGPRIASAMGVIGMAILGLSLFLSVKVSGRAAGEAFRL